MIAAAHELDATPIEPGLAVPADRGALMEMYRTFEPRGGPLGLPPAGDVQGWLDSIATDANFVLHLDDRIAGHFVLCSDGESAELAVFVHQDYRSLGLGKKLVAAAIAEARRRGLKRVWGVTEPDNLPMLRLALSLGFALEDNPQRYSLDLEAGDVPGHRGQLASAPAPI